MKNETSWNEAYFDCHVQPAERVKRWIRAGKLVGGSALLLFSVSLGAWAAAEQSSGWIELFHVPPCLHSHSSAKAYGSAHGEKANPLS